MKAILFTIAPWLYSCFNCY